MHIASAGRKHRQRLRNWQNLAPPQTRFLSSLVEGNLVVLAESAGFQRRLDLLCLREIPDPKIQYQLLPAHAHAAERFHPLGESGGTASAVLSSVGKALVVADGMVAAIRLGAHR
jgi:hypothetical protein